MKHRGREGLQRFAKRDWTGHMWLLDGHASDPASLR